MCDDASTDKSLQIMREYEKKYSNIYVLKNEKNMGLNYTLNKCLEVANGQFIARMDGDDISLKNRFEEEIKVLLEKPNISIVSCPMIYFDSKGEWGRGTMIEYPQKEDFIKGTPFCHAPCMVRREAYMAVQGYSVEERLLRVEDYHLWMKMYAEGYKGYNIQRPLYKMRDDRNATARRKFKYRLNEYISKYVVINQYLCCVKGKSAFTTVFKENGTAPITIKNTNIKDDQNSIFPPKEKICLYLNSFVLKKYPLIRTKQFTCTYINAYIV